MIRHIDAILARLGNERQISAILQAGETFEKSDYPSLLSQLSASAQDENSDSPEPKRMVSVKTITAPGIGGVLESEADVDNYLAALRAALVATLNSGKRITV